MVAIFRGAEDAHFSPIGGPAVSTSAPTFRSGFARCALTSFSSTSWWRIPSSFGINVTGSWWFTARAYNSAPTGAAIQWGILSAGDIIRLALVGIGGNMFKLTKYDSGGNATDLITSTAPLALLSAQKLDIFVSYSVGGGVQVYGDGDLLLSYSGDVTTNGVTAITGMDLRTAFTFTSWSEIIWDTSDTRSWSLATQAPAALGNTTQWSGDQTDVNEIVTNDGNSIRTPNPVQLEQFTVNQLPAGDWAVIDNTVWSRAMALSPGDPQHLERNVRTHSNDYFSSDDTLTSAFVNNWTTWATNPATGVAWTQAELNDSTYNIGVKSIA